MQKLPSPMFFPHDEPDPCVGYNLIEWSTSFLILFKELNNITARSYEVVAVLTAKSGLPTYPKKIVSPVNKQTCLWFLSESKKQELSKVWPGVWRTLTQTDPRLKEELSCI